MLNNHIDELFKEKLKNSKKQKKKYFLYELKYQKKCQNMIDIFLKKYFALNKIFKSYFTNEIWNFIEVVKR